MLAVPAGIYPIAKSLLKLKLFFISSLIANETDPSPPANNNLLY